MQSGSQVQCTLGAPDLRSHSDLTHHLWACAPRFTPKGAQSLKDAAWVSSMYGGSLRNIEVQFFATRLGSEGDNILTVVCA